MLLKISIRENLKYVREKSENVFSKIVGPNQLIITNNFKN